MSLSEELFGKRFIELSSDEKKAWRREYSKRKLKTDPEYRKRRNDSCKKWCSKNKERVRARGRTYGKPYYQKNKKRIQTNHSRCMDKLKQQFFDRYGRNCACCGESDPVFLTIEHIGGGGNQHRKQLKNESADCVMSDIRKRGWPAGYETLCMNCNFARWRNKGMCPHEKAVNDVMLAVI